VPAQIGSRQLKSSSAHCARKLAKSWQGGNKYGSSGSGSGNRYRIGKGKEKKKKKKKEKKNNKNKFNKN